ncbi:ABC transporter substrate-binding protein [Bacillus sp. M6-12]|uniref:ABC transporter substrate-binding protein n=1 Tax=Bacillus sp. M6-12 TaxID=2054166 RepID=UPI0015E0E5C7|nr:ABC transporter substrate-binding protein [Bacillus sp. M6-12]
MKKYSLILLCMLLIIFTVACSSEKTSSGDKATASGDKGPIKIGASLSLTGGFGFAGESMQKTMNLLVEQTNKDGGINGRQLEIVYTDDENIPENSVRNVTKLIQKEDLKIIIGPNSTATSKAVEPLALSNKAIMFSLSGAYVGPPNSYAFSSSYGQSIMHDLIHEWALSKGYKKVGMVATNDASGDLSVGLVKKLDGKDGVKYLIERMGVQDVDVTPQLTKLNSEGIEALVVIGPGVAAGVTIKGSGKLNPELPIIATHSQLSDTFAKSIREFIPDNMYITGPPVMASDELSDSNPMKEKLIKFVDEYNKKYGENPDYLGAIGYDSLSLIIEGLKAVGDDSAKMKDFLENDVKDFQGVHATFNLTPEDHRGTSSEGVVLLKLNKDLSWGIAWDPSSK